MALMEEAEQEIADLIGDDAAFALVENFGGARIPIPKDASASQLRLVIGNDAAAKLSDLRGGTYLKVPVARAWRARVYRERGYSYAQIATALCMSESAVHSVLRAGGLTHVAAPKAPAPVGTPLANAVRRALEGRDE